MQLTSNREVQTTQSVVEITTALELPSRHGSRVLILANGGEQKYRLDTNSVNRSIE